MFPLHALLVVGSLATPDLDLDAPAAPLATYQAVAAAWELIDENERFWMFRREDVFPVQLTLIRERYLDLRDAPPSVDAARFPSLPFCWDMMLFNQNYRNYLDERARIDRASWVTEARQEALGLYHIWDLAGDAQRKGYGVFFRRQALRDLRELLGPHAYYAGCLPPPVPVWRYARSD